MASDDITLEVLRDIRDSVRETNTRLDATNARLDTHIEETRKGFEAVNRKFEDVGRRIVESEMRVATEVVALAGTLHEVRDMLVKQSDLRGRVERCEDDIADLKRQLGSDQRR